MHRMIHRRAERVVGMKIECLYERDLFADLDIPSTEIVFGASLKK